MSSRVQNPVDDERYRGLLGAWNHPDEDLPFVMRAFANAMPVDYRGWAEVIRGWAYRLEREPDLPSDEKEGTQETQRVQEQCNRFRHDEHCAHLHES